MRTLRHHILRSCGTILRALFLFHPLRKFLLAALVFAVLGACMILWSLVQGGSNRMIFGGLMLVASLQFLVIGVIADSFASQRRLLTEDAAFPVHRS